MITLNDVARVAGVSAKTVSRAVNGERDISEATREHILRIADQMEYVPHAQASRLASGRTRSIALHYPLANPLLFSERLEMSFVSGIAMGAAHDDYYFTLFTGELSPRELRRICKGSIADGLILMQVALEDWRVDTLRELDYPFAMIGRCRDNTGISFIDFDFEQALLDAYDFLVTLGHSKIGLLTYPTSWRVGGLGPALRARAGFQAAIAKHGLEPISVECDLDVEASTAAAGQLLAEHPEVTAVIAMHNTTAVGAIHAIHAAGRTVPDDLSVVGIAFGADSDLVIPPLTAIHWDAQQIGRDAAQMIIRRLDKGPGPVHQELVRPRFVIRKSASPPRSQSVREQVKQGYREH
jgi:DNA-binding LacI/PurR family transcriptional regulator